MYDVHGVASYGPWGLSASPKLAQPFANSVQTFLSVSQSLSRQIGISCGDSTGLMARTRAQKHSDAGGPKPQGRNTVAARDQKKMSGHENKKRKVEDIDKPSGEKETEEQAPTPKKNKIARSTSPEDTKPKQSGVDVNKLNALLSSYGVHPLQDTDLPKQNEPTPETVLSLLYLAMLISARISHQLAYKTLQCLIEAGYQDIETLRKSTWQERTEVLTKGGYTRYREKTATSLGELAEFINKEYGALYLNALSPQSLPLTPSTMIDNDLNNLLKRADFSSTKVRT